MNTRYIARALSAIVLACSAGLYLFNPAKAGSDNPILKSCIDAQDYAIKIETCTSALEQSDLTDQERGRATFHLAMAVRPLDQQRSIELYTQSIAFYPTNLSAYFNRGSLYQDVKEYDLAAADLTTVIDRMKPRNFEELYGAYWLRASVYADQEKFVEALADVEQALAYDPNDIDAITTKADILSSQEKYGEALGVLDDAIARLPAQTNINRLWKERAWVNGKLDNAGEALADIDKAMKLGGESAWVWYWRGRMHWDLEDRKASYADFQNSLAIDPHYCRSIWAINSWSNRVLDMVEAAPLEARDLVDDVLAEYPEGFKLLRLRFLASLEAEELETALQDINRMIEVAEYPDVSLFARARLFKSLGRYDLALADLILLIDREEIQTEFIRQISQEMVELNDAGKKCVAEALSWESMDLMVLHRYALKQKMIVHTEVSDWESVISTLDLMIEDDPDDVDNLQMRGIAQEELGRPDDALVSYDQAIRLIESGDAESPARDNSYANTYDYRGSIHQSHRRVEQAQSDFDSALRLGDSEYVTAFQRRMQKAGHYQGALNGTIDAATGAAVHLCAADINCTDPDL